jgi:hypothetical protein
MPRVLTVFFIFLSLCGLFSCRSTDNRIGTYQSRFPVLYSQTKISLTTDSTFEYAVRSDVFRDSAIGYYKMYGRKIFLIFDTKLFDSNSGFVRFDSIPFKMAIIENDSIPYQLSYYLGHNKLFKADIKTDKKVTKLKGYGRRKKFLFWGSHYYRRRYFYERIN